MTTPIASVRIFADDVPTTAAFYETWCGLSERMDTHGAVVFAGAPMVVVERAEDADGALRGRFLGVAFWTDDIAALAARLADAAIATHGPPERQPWGGVLLHADDPSGNTVTFLERATP